MKEPRIEYWDCDEGAEVLDHTKLDEAIEYALDDMYPDQWPETIEVHGFARCPKPDAALYIGSVLEDLHALLDENHGPPDEYTEPTDAMRAAELVFVEAVIKDYEVWCCYKVCTETVNVAEWVRKHRPEWLQDDG